MVMASGAMAWCLVLVGCVVSTSAFVLEGSPQTFAQYPRWNPGPNGSLEFAFQTQDPSGLLLYADDGGSYEFFAVKLVEGAVRLQYNLGGGSRLLSVGRGLNDGAWHSVRIQRNFQQTSLSVDGHTETRQAKALDHEFGSASSNSYVYFGGLPELLTRQVGGAKLTLPVVALEPRLLAQIANVSYAEGARGHARPVLPVASKVGIGCVRKVVSWSGQTVKMRHWSNWVIKGPPQPLSAEASKVYQGWWDRILG